MKKITTIATTDINSYLIPDNKHLAPIIREIMELCKSKNLSYVEMNKVLYLADIELYNQTITKKEQIND